MSVVTLATARKKIQREMDFEEETQVQAQEWVEYFNDAIRDAEQTILKLYEGYFLTKTTIDLVAGTKNYAMPANIYANKIRLLQYANGNYIYKIWPAKLKDVAYLDQYAQPSNQNMKFTVQNVDATTGPQIYFHPTPQSTETGTVTLWYIRNANTVALDTDIIDIQEFISFIYAYVRVKVALKENSPKLPIYVQMLEGSGNMKGERDKMKEALDDMIPDEDKTLPSDMSFYEDFNAYDYWESI